MTDPLSVLVVEDAEPDFELIVRALRRCGIPAKCVRVDTEDEYCKQLQTQPDIILSDYVLPSFNAEGALQLLRQSGLDIPLIVLTGVVSEETVVESMKLGAADYLLKDRMTRLGPAIRRAIAEHRLRAEKRLAEENASRERELKELAEARAALASDLAKANQELQESNRRLRETQVQLIQNEKMASLGQLVAGIAHEINNPLAFVVNNLYLVESGLTTLAPEMDSLLSTQASSKLAKLRNRLHEMKDGLDRVKELVLDLRTFSRLDGGELMRADIADMIGSVLVLLNHKMNGRIAVEKNFGPVRAVYCYPGRLQQVVLNLIANAIDAIEGPGVITVATSATDEHFLISIRDSGKGIPDAIRGKIFDPFFTTKAIGDGTGLGLAISYGIVEEHGGFIHVESQEGAGAEFIVKIPLNPPLQKAP